MLVKIPSCLLPLEIRALLEAGPATDEIPGSSGEFGRDPRNPVPVNGPIGQALYPSLTMNPGQFVFAHRLGSLGKVDVFETVTSDGSHWDLLYLSLYHPRKSRKAPPATASAALGRRPLSPPSQSPSRTFLIRCGRRFQSGPNRPSASLSHLGKLERPLSSTGSPAQRNMLPRSKCCNYTGKLKRRRTRECRR